MKIYNPWIACQNPLDLLSREGGRYDLQTVIPGRMENEGNIAGIEPL